MKQGYKDVWAGVLFLVCFLVTVVWGVVNMVRWNPNESPRSTSSTIAPTHSPENSNNMNMGHVSVMVVASICASAGLSIVLLALLVIFPYQIIYAAMLFSIAVMAAMAILSFV